MAERTVVVRLKALTEDYQRAMRGAKSATDQVVSQADRWRRLGQSTAGLGDSLTRNVTLPIVAVGAAAAKMALDFDSAFTQMQSLAGVSSDEIAGLKDSVLNLAGSTGKAPQELAEALYFLRSSGLDGAAAMDALEMSAKASAAGLGSTIQVADAVSSAMNAYARSGLTAAEATDVLVATARAGKAEPAELAAQMGRVLPIASELGVTFEDVGAAIASLSLSGNDAAGATTQLTALLSKILRPSQQAREQIEGIGISLDELQGMVAGGDLLGALEELRARLGDNGFANFLEDQQAVLAGLALTGENVAKNREIFAQLEEATGSLDNAFGSWAQSMGAKNAIAFGKFQEAMIRLGDAVLPIASDVMGFAGDIAEAFSDLPAGAQDAVIAFAAVAAGLGPLMSVGGRAIDAISGINNAISKFTGMSGGLGSGLANVGFGLGVLLPLTIAAGVALSDYVNTKAEAKRVTDLYADALARETAGTEGAVDAVTAAQLATGDLGAALRDAGADLELFNQAIKTSGDEIERLDDLRENPELMMREIDELADSGSALGQELQRLNEDLSLGEMSDLIDRLDGLSDRHDDAAAATRNQDYAEEQLAGTLAGTELAVEQVTAALDEQLKAMQSLFDPLFGYANSLTSNAEAQQGVVEAQQHLNDLLAQATPNIDEVRAAEDALSEAHRRAGQSALDVAMAEATLKAGLEAGSVSIDQARTQLEAWVEQGLITRETADRLGAEFEVYAAKVEAIPDHRNTDITETGAQKTGRTLEWVKQRAEQIPQRRGIQTFASGAGAAVNQLRWVKDTADRIPKSVDVWVNVKTRGGFGNIPGKQHGGPITAGRPYVVGEAGPELFISDESGTILPNSHLERLMSTSDLHSRSAGVQGVRSIYAGFGDLSSVIQQSTTRLLTGLGGELRRIRHDTDHISNGIHTLIKQAAWGPENVRWFEDLNSIHRKAKVPGFHQGGVVPGRPGEEILALLQAGETVIPASAPMASAGTTVVFQPGAISFEGAIAPNGQAMQQLVAHAFNAALRSSLVNIRSEAVRP